VKFSISIQSEVLTAFPVALCQVYCRIIPVYIWVGTDHGGINIIDKSDFSIMLMTNVPGDMTSLSGNSIRSLHKGDDGIIWVGTFKNGINYYHEQLYQFKLFRSHPFQTGQWFLQ
jgi:hypothetical protein